ncbi:MAG: polysaccharide export protein [Spirochaetes bacterium]|nr:polysaccharide export protein [Spirochaetota bacterium]
MKKCLMYIAIFSIVLFTFVFSKNVNAEEYKVGIGDILEVRILKPDPSNDRVTVSPSGDISVAYLGSVKVKNKTITEIQRIVQTRLANGYLKYPVVTVSLVESRSRNFTITGEINNPGSYSLTENTTVLKAISVAGGFTRFGSKSKVRILRPRGDRPGYTKIEVDVSKVMDGDARADIVIEPGDIIVISESFF